MGRMKLKDMSPEQRNKIRKRNLKTSAERRQKRLDHLRMVALYNGFVTAR